MTFQRFALTVGIGLAAGFAAARIKEAAVGKKDRPGGRSLQEVTNLEKIRNLGGEELVDRISELLNILWEAGEYRLPEMVCDGQGGCQGDGNCTQTRHRECIRRWLNRPAEDWDD